MLYHLLYHLGVWLLILLCKVTQIVAVFLRSRPPPPSAVSRKDRIASPQTAGKQEIKAKAWMQEKQDEESALDAKKRRRLGELPPTWTLHQPSDAAAPFPAVYTCLEQLKNI